MGPEPAFEAVGRLDGAVFLRTGAVDRRRHQPVMLAEREILVVEAARGLAAFELMGRGRALVGAPPVRRAPEDEERGWQPGLEREYRLAAAGRGVLDVAVAQDGVAGAGGRRGRPAR